VPAIAVIQKELTLFIFIRCKWYVDDYLKYIFKSKFDFLKAYIFIIRVIIVMIEFLKETM